MTSRPLSTASSRRPADPPAPALDPVELPNLLPTPVTSVGPGDLVEAVALTDGATGPTQAPGELSDAAAAPTDVVDLTGARLLASSITLTRTPEVVLRQTALNEVVLPGPDVPVLRAPYGQWRDVVVEGGRLGSAEAYDAEWTRVLLRGVRVRYLNLRGAHLRDVALVDCTIDELDLGGAQLQRVALAGSRVQRLEVTSARLEAVDLRGCGLTEIVGAAGLAGACIDPGQLHELAPVLAAELGIRVVGA